MKTLRAVTPALLLSILAIAQADAQSGCATNSVFSPPFAGSAWVSVSVSSNFPNLDAVTNGLEFWNQSACGDSGGSGFDFPYYAIAGSFSPTLTITWVAGHAPGIGECAPSYCAAESFPGGSINVYQYWGPDGTTPTPTNADELGWIIAHEVGHMQGLGDGSCNAGVMNVPVPIWPQLTAEECQRADNRNALPGEDDDPPIDPPCCESPILVQLEGRRFDLTGPSDPVYFDIDASGDAELITWTAASSRTALLALDRNSNGYIDDGSELFGNNTPPTFTNGYDALSHFDRAAMGGNEDGIIDSGDAVWPFLRLWLDDNHNGVSELAELNTPAGEGVLAFSCGYSTSWRRDQHGNIFRFKGQGWRLNPAGYAASIATYDVFFQLVD